ncbi:MAG: tRNA (adenosine(37)-N6)-dimethylallyltransferase MiaA [Frankiaceae bacterium]
MRVIAVVGPTAAGKSSSGIALAQALGGEVINADSMQLYRGMDIGTAKVPVAERGGVPHHLLDIWDLTQPASAAQYQRQARECLDGVLARGITPVVVGGSGLYLRAALDVLTFPATDPQLRSRLEEELAVAGPGPLHSRLAERDPGAAAAILASNGRRIVRALEVVELTGSYSRNLASYVSAYDVHYVGLAVDSALLRQRIADRVSGMWHRGLVEEVRSLEAVGLRAGPTAGRALGYAQVLAFLEGRLTEAEARDDTIRATRRFARRQRSWFGRDPRIHWLTPMPPSEAVRHVAAAVR